MELHHACFAFSIEAMVRGYHVYQSVWEAVSGEVLECSWEIGNRGDPYAIAVIVSCARDYSCNEEF